MTDDQQFKEALRALALDAKEYALYFGELGVTHIEEASRAESTHVAEQTSGARSTARTFAASSALERNARAETNTTKPIVERPSPEGAIIKPSGEQKTIFSNSQTTMAKRTTPTTRKDAQGAPPPPPPQETLFGEVTPQDEASLPRPDETLEDIWNDITPQCMRCPLCCQGRTQVVNSEGNRQARLMFVGEAPGADEDAQGRPFVGRAGQLLNKIVEAIGMKREDVFIGNVNRCRPPQNRTPTLAEAKICKPFLLREISVVRPDVIVVLGNTAMKNLLDTKEGITKLRGQFQDYQGIKVMPTFHPAYLLRDPTKKRETWEDMKKVRAFLQSTLREKE